MSTSTTVLAAVFPDRESAVATRDALGEEHYRFRWLATTRPAEHVERDADAAVPEPHEVVESSDGAVGAIGRFLSGAGASLRKALRDHGVAEGDAETIDAAVPDGGAVLVVHAAAERVADATAILQQGGGRLYAGDDTSLEGAPGGVTTSEAYSRGLIPDGDTTVPATTDPLGLGASAAVESATLGAPDAAGVTNAIGRHDDALVERHDDALDARRDDTLDARPDDTLVERRDDIAVARRDEALASTPTDEAVAPAAAATPEHDSDEYVVRKRTVTEMVSIEVPVTREEVFMERRSRGTGVPAPESPPSP